MKTIYYNVIKNSNIKILMLEKSNFPHFHLTATPISIAWCQIETLVVWKFLRAVKNLLSAFFCWFFTLYIEIHIKKNNVNKSLADRHTFQYIYFCRKGRQFYLMDFFCVLFVLLWEDMSNKYAPESRVVWYRSIFFLKWNILFLLWKIRNQTFNWLSNGISDFRIAQ